MIAIFFLLLLLYLSSLSLEEVIEDKHHQSRHKHHLKRVGHNHTDSLRQYFKHSPYYSSLPRPPKIAFLFLTRYNLPLQEIWEEFFTFQASPLYYNIYVHPSTPHTFPKNSVFHDSVIQTQVRSGWGSMTQVQAIRLLFSAALEDLDNQFFPLFSESCLPLYSFQKWYRVLLNNPPKSIVNACPFTVPKDMELTRWHPDLEQSKMLKKSHWRKSATWVMLIRKHATIFSEYTDDDKYWENVKCVDEHFLPTILAMHGVENETTCSDGFTSVSWYKWNSAHPRIFANEQLDKEGFYKFRFEKLDEIHQSKEKDIIGMNARCSGYQGICHFAVRKFSYLSKYHLLAYLDQVLIDDRDDIYYNPLSPPSSWSESYSEQFRHSRSINYTHYDFMDHLLGRVRVVKGSSDLTFIDNGYRRYFSDLKSMRFFLRIPDHVTNEELISKMKELSEEESRLPELKYPHYLQIHDNMLIKQRKRPLVWVLQNNTRRHVLTGE
eukprot:gene15803-17766_t